MNIYIDVADTAAAVKIVINSSHSNAIDERDTVSKRVRKRKRERGRQTAAHPDMQWVLQSHTIYVCNMFNILYMQYIKWQSLTLPECDSVKCFRQCNAM